MHSPSWTRLKLLLLQKKRNSGTAPRLPYLWLKMRNSESVAKLLHKTRVLQPPLLKQANKNPRSRRSINTNVSRSSQARRSKSSNNQN